MATSSSTAKPCTKIMIDSPWLPAEKWYKSMRYYCLKQWVPLSNCCFIYPRLFFLFLLLHSQKTHWYFLKQMFVLQGQPSWQKLSVLQHLSCWRRVHQWFWHTPRIANSFRFRSQLWWKNKEFKKLYLEQGQGLGWERKCQHLSELSDIGSGEWWHICQVNSNNFILGVKWSLQIFTNVWRQIGDFESTGKVDSWWISPLKDDDDP